MSSPFRFSSSVSRRSFINTSVKSVGGIAALSLPVPFTNSADAKEKQFTVQQIIDLILKEGRLAPLDKTTDTIKAGDASQIVRGIATTMFPTVNVIEEAAGKGANFIIAHEPSFYNHTDTAEWMDANEVKRQKEDLLKKHQIAIWRFHDYCHLLKPDAITYGVVKKANWLDYYRPSENILTIPPTSLAQLVAHLKSSLSIKNLRVIGNLQQSCQRIALIPGAVGGRNQITMVEAENPDVLIVGEVSEWETPEYIRDRRSLGKETSLIILGHSVSEEPGMEWVASWLRPKLQGLDIFHVSSGDPFVWL